MASAVFEELKTVATEVKTNQIEGTGCGERFVGSPGGGIVTLLLIVIVKAGVEGGGGRLECRSTDIKEGVVGNLARRKRAGGIGGGVEQRDRKEDRLAPYSEG